MVKVGGKAESVSQMNRRLTDDYREAFDLFEEGDLEQAEDIFAGAALAQLYCHNGNHNKARDLLMQYIGRERFHIMELKALYVAQAQIAMHLGNHDDAMNVLRALESLVEEGDPEVIALRQRIEPKSALSGLAGFFK